MSVIVVRIPVSHVSQRRFIVLEIYSSPVFPEGQKGAPLQFLNGAGMAQKECAIPSETTSWNGNGARARHSALPNGAAEELPFQRSSSFAERLAQARELLKEWSSDLADLDKELEPVWLEERNLKDRIAATHKRDERGRIVLNPGGRDERAPLYGKLLRIAEQWGKTKEQRRLADRQCRSLIREINMLTKLIEKGRQRPNGRAA